MNARKMLQDKLNEIKSRLSSSPTIFNTEEEVYECINDIATLIRDLFPFADEHHILSDLLKELFSNIKEFLIAGMNNKWEAVNHLGNALSECSCINTRIYDRFHNDRRTEIESSILANT